MKICVTAQQDNLNSLIDPRFGRCQYFIVFDDETQQYKAIRNTAAFAGGGAGIKATQLLILNHVDTLITGRLGPKATNALNATRIQVILKKSGSVKNILEQFRKGEMTEEKHPLISDTLLRLGQQHARQVLR